MTNLNNLKLWLVAVALTAAMIHSGNSLTKAVILAAVTGSMKKDVIIPTIILKTATEAEITRKSAEKCSLGEFLLHSLVWEPCL